MIQFCHDREFQHFATDWETNIGIQRLYRINPKGGRTIAVEVPTVEEFSVLSPSLKNPIPVKIGIAACSKKDLYNKKVGRELAVSRLKEYNFFVTCEMPPSIPGEPRIVQLHNSELDITIQFAKYENSQRVYFEGVV